MAVSHSLSAYCFYDVGTFVTHISVSVVFKKEHLAVVKMCTSQVTLHVEE